MSSLIKSIVIVFFTTLIISCTNEDDFPNTYVNETIPITMPEYNNIYNNPWGYEYISGGLGGIIIVNDGFTENGFIAYERACTHEKNSTCIISSEGGSSNNTILICNCCNSKFMIFDGSVNEGVANQALKRYYTYLNGGILYITN
ncbi:MAG: hypothetical protein CMP50_02780 [Flavobacteriales bacterium]|nr:hypothetical protein [Flavobacteriales bacterium]|tara:strand:- start:744 stop:1178 length:435 start_codon:yes stop_codon:yes gene_type:complete